MENFWNKALQVAAGLWAAATLYTFIDTPEADFESQKPKDKTEKIDKSEKISKMTANYNNEAYRIVWNTVFISDKNQTSGQNPYVENDVEKKNESFKIEDFKKELEEKWVQKWNFDDFDDDIIKLTSNVWDLYWSWIMNIFQEAALSPYFAMALIPWSTMSSVFWDESLVLLEDKYWESVSNEILETGLKNLDYPNLLSIWKKLSYNYPKWMDILVNAIIRELEKKPASIGQWWFKMLFHYVWRWRLREHMGYLGSIIPHEYLKEEDKSLIIEAFWEEWASILNSWNKK